MSTLAILAGFALMLFLPCAFAMLGSRDTEDDSVYSDRTVEPIAPTRSAQAVEVESPTIPALAVRAQAIEESAAQVPAVETPAAEIPIAKVPAAKTPEPAAQAEIDPVLSNRTPKTHRARILRNEIEALMATAAAARAQADALAANARLAVAKAEAADAAATDAEDAAAAAIHEMRRAA